MRSSREHVDQVPRHEAGEQHQPHADHAPEHLTLVASALRPEVDQDDAQAVDRVERDAGDEHDLPEPHERVLVCAEHRVVSLGRDADQRGIEHVDQEEEEDRDPGDAVKHPRPHALASAVQRSAGGLGRGFRNRRCQASACGHGRPP
ncbi:hypothetical protein ABE10_00835, partial [Bacillus toyonensis]|nr:hypothetical protein [Bacillus toyonensis]